jgi:hypothetical protein
MTVMKSWQIHFVKTHNALFCSPLELYDKSQQSTAHVTNLACYLFSQIKFCWNSALAICLHVVHGCFHVTMAELTSYNRNHEAHKAKTICFTQKVQRLMLHQLYYCQAEHILPGMGALSDHYSYFA